MDTKAYHNLDPKLKAAYDRIMGTAAGGSQHHNPATPHPESNATAHHQSAPSPKSSGHLSHLAFNAATGTKKEKEHGPIGVKADSMLLPIILSVTGVAFFVIYSYFWMNFFGMT